MNRPPSYHSASGLSKSSSVYQSVPTFPTGYYCDNGPVSASSFDQRQLPCRRNSKFRQVLAITLGLLVTLLLPLALWCWYVFYKERTVFDWPHLAVLTTTNATRFLLLSTISTTVTKAIVGPLMALHAYSASEDWLRSSGRVDVRRLPSPTQMGSLLTLYQGSSFIGLFNTCCGGLRRGHLAWPPVLKRVVAVLAWLLFLAYSMTAVSLWLQIDAEPVRSVPTTSDFPSLGYDSRNTLFARTVNRTLCAFEDDKQMKSTFPIRPCGLVNYARPPDGVPLTTSLGLEVLTNNSDVSRAAWLNDNTAILVPSNTPTIGYRAKALGVRAVCKSITDKCVKCDSTKPDVRNSCLFSYGLNCTASTKVHIDDPSMASHVAGPISPVNGSAIFQDFNINPFPYGNVIRSASYVNATLQPLTVDYFAGNTGFVVYYNRVAINVLYCDVSVYNVTYQFTPPETYVSTSPVLADTVTAGYVAYGMVAWFQHESQTAGRGFEVIDGAGQRGNATYPDIYGRQLSKIGISALGRILPATSSDLLLAGSGTRVTLVGMLLLFILYACIIITTVAIGTQAAIVIIYSDSKFLAAARGRLISAYALIGDSFGGLDYDFEHHKSAVSAAVHEGAFLRETEADRLQLEQDLIEGGPMKGRTVRLRPRRI